MQVLSYMNNTLTVANCLDLVALNRGQTRDVACSSRWLSSLLLVKSLPIAIELARSYLVLFGQMGEAIVRL